jgi:hypothetical protein
MKELRRIIDRLRSLYASAGATGAANDLSKVAKSLSDHQNLSVDAFVAETKARLRKRDVPLTEEIDEDTIESYTRRLLSARMNLREFDTLFAELKTTKALTKPILDAIANRYLNEPSGGDHEFKFKTRAAALQAIKDTFIERAESESKRGIIEKITRFS